MKMAESKFRIWAKTVAIVELVFYTFSALMFLLAVALALVGTENIFGEYKPKLERTGVIDEQAAESFGAKFAGLSGIIRVLLLIVVTGFLALHILFAYNLLQATHIRLTDTFSALEKSRLWRFLAIVVFVLSLISLAKVRYLPVTLIGLIFRGVSLWIVHSFIKDLESGERQIQHPQKTLDNDISKPPPYSRMA